VDPLLEVDGLARSFGETRALAEATLRVRPAEVHALAGENGSGKSTLIKILSGVIRPDAGTVRWRGEPVRLGRPAAAQARGIATVFQETLVAPELSVRDNIWIGTDSTFRHGRSREAEHEGADRALRVLGLDTLSLDRPAFSLSLAERQLVTIARALVRPWQLLILDEGTSALDAGQRDRLFEHLREERAAGKAVLFTSHRMDELFSLADTISVLRAGRTVAELVPGETAHREVLVRMSGRTTAEHALGATAPAAAREPGEPVLRVRELRLRPGAAAASLDLRRGEILGVAGLEGHGQGEFADCVCGLRRAVSGSVSVMDGAGHWRAVRGYAEANRHGVRYVPRDRRNEGLFTPLSVFENFAVASFGRISRGGLLDRREARRGYRSFAEACRLVAGRPSNPITTLSGGNQQKILLGRWIAMQPRVLVLNDPLRGVDANTKEELYGYFRELAGTGVSIVFLSSEILELLTIADRVAVFREGGPTAMLPAAGTSETEVVAAMFGHEGEGAA
jgi:ribose transport system ATP-binding protein